MTIKTDEQQKVYIIPNNFEDTLMTSSGIKVKNIVEGIVATSFISIPTIFSGLDLKIKIAIFIIGVFPILFLFVRGKDNCSLLEYLWNYIKYHLGVKVIKEKPLFSKQNKL